MTTAVDRTAAQTARYATATCEVGRQCNVSVLDIWSVFMQMAGWRHGDTILPGSKKIDKKLIFSELLVDGKKNQAAY